MFEKFTEKAISVMTSAQREAKNFHHAKLEPEHIFLAILEQKSGIASKFLKAAGITYDALKIEIDKLNIEKTKKEEEIIPFSEAVKHILKIAWDKSIEMQNRSIMPEHLFLAIVDSKNLNVINLFNRFDIDIARIKNSTEKVVQKKTKNATHPEFVSNYLSAGSPDNELINSFLEDEKTKELFANANRLAKENGFEVIGTAQILNALLDDKVTDEMAPNKDILRNLLSKDETRKEDYEEEFLYTPKATEVIHTALDIAKEAGSPCVTPEHLLAGILKNHYNSASKILKDANINIKYLLQRIFAKIDQQKTTSSQILKLAKQETLRLGHSTVGSELILLGIIAEGIGVGAQVLEELGVNLKDARKVVEHIIGYGNNYDAKNVSLSPRAKQVIDNAWQIAKNSKKNRIDSEHILNGIIKVQDCVANRVLEELGVDSLEVINGIERKLSQG